MPHAVSAVVQCREAVLPGAISQDTLLHNLRTGEILPSARTNEQESSNLLARQVPLWNVEC
jgi:hypothetical protein